MRLSLLLPATAADRPRPLAPVVAQARWQLLLSPGAPYIHPDTCHARPHCHHHQHRRQAPRISLQPAQELLFRQCLRR